MTGHHAGAAFLTEPPSGAARPTAKIRASSLSLHGGVRAFVRQRVLPRAEQLERPDFSLLGELLREAGDAGILGASLPEDHGGLGLGVLDSLLVAHALGGSPSFAVTVGAHSGLTGAAIHLGGDEPQHARWLPGIAAGTSVGCYALTEPDAGSDALALRSVARRDGDGWRLTGSKQFITNAGIADVAVVFALAEGTAFSTFLVPMRAAGVTLGPEEHKLGLRGSSTRPLHLDDVFVSADHLLGRPGRGHRTAFAVLTQGRLRLAAGAFGEARHLLDVVSEHCRRRHQFGRPLASFGITRRKLGELAADLLAGEATLWACASRLDATLAAIPGDGAARARRVPMRITDFDVEAALCKVLASELIGRVADETLQLFGGYGYVEDGPAARAWRDARIHRIYEGTNEICRLLVAPAMLRRLGQGPWVRGLTDREDWTVSSAHAVADLTLAALEVAAGCGDALNERQGLAEIVADCSAEALRVRSLAEAPLQPLGGLALPLVTRQALERCFLAVARLAPGAPALSAARALLQGGPDVIALTEELGQRVVEGETLPL